MISKITRHTIAHPEVDAIQFGKSSKIKLLQEFVDKYEKNCKIKTVNKGLVLQLKTDFDKGSQIKYAGLGDWLIGNELHGFAIMSDEKFKEMFNRITD